MDVINVPFIYLEMSINICWDLKRIWRSKSPSRIQGKMHLRHRTIYYYRKVSIMSISNALMMLMHQFSVQFWIIMGINRWSAILGILYLRIDWYVIPFWNLNFDKYLHTFLHFKFRITFQIKFKVLLEPFYKVGMPLTYEFDMFVNSTNPENEYTINNNHKHIDVEIWVETELSVERLLYFYHTCFEINWNWIIEPKLIFTPQLFATGRHGIL